MGGGASAPTIFARGEMRRRCRVCRTAVPGKTLELAELLDKHGRLEAFSSQAHISLMRLLGEKMDTYVIRFERKRLNTLLVANDFGDIV